MVITSLADLYISLAEGQRVGAFRRSLNQITNKMFSDMDVRRLDADRPMATISTYALLTISKNRCHGVYL